MADPVRYVRGRRGFVEAHPGDIVGKAVMVALLAFVWIFLATLVILLMDGARLAAGKILFEVVSAFGTVGLSCGITPLLSPVSKVVIILTMYLGRVGPLLLAISLLGEEMQDPTHISYPRERVMTG